MRFKVVLVLLPVLLSLTSCKINSCSSTESTDSSSTSDTTTSIEKPDNDQSGVEVINNFTYTLNDINRTNGWCSVNPIGNVSLLVVPVDWNGDNYEWTDKKLEDINKIYFGEAADTEWHSVKSFYYASSYGNLNINGEVSDVLTISSATAFNKAPDELAYAVLNKSSDFSSLRKKYDTDGDGYIDAVCFVYNRPISYNNSDDYWAFVYYDPSSTANVNDPQVNLYMWVSYDFIHEGYGNSKLDGHTFIHETGHLLGLNDYYSDSGEWDASGGKEMHSYNIGDENIYAKMSLGWVNPYYVKTDSSVTLTLRTSAFYGDAIIINDSWNGSALDEYIAIEYYSPDNLNYRDSYDSIRKSEGISMFTTSGFRIYHIDARIVKYSGNFFRGYADSIDGNYEYYIGASNATSYSYLNTMSDRKNYKEVHLLEPDGVNTLKTGKLATNDSLFVAGDTFTATSAFFSNGDNKFNDGSDVGYRIDIIESNETTGTLTITKI